MIREEINDVVDAGVKFDASESDAFFPHAAATFRTYHNHVTAAIEASYQVEAAAALKSSGSVSRFAAILLSGPTTPARR